jgi:bifunctional non-homologous end joining protein LigD
MMVFDLDPGPRMTLLDCLRVGKQMREALEHFGLRSFAKTSGKKGLHLAVPLNTAVTFDQTKAFARAIGQVLEREDPKRLTTNMSKSVRGGRIFIDWSQNDRHKTTICAYSMRAFERPTVSAPVTWDEIDEALEERDAARLISETSDVLERVEKLGDPFEPVLKLKQKLPKFKE